MARQINSEITGTIGNIIFYESEGRFFMRTVQVQALASQKTAKDFGKASSKAKILRNLLTPVLPDPKDKEMQNRLTTAMRKFRASLSDNEEIQALENPLAGFRLTLTSDLKDCLQFAWTITELPDNTIKFEIPAINPVQSIKAPAGTSRVQIKLMSAVFHPDNERSFASNPEVLDIPYTNAMQPALNVVLECGSEPGSIVVVAAALSYWNQNNRISETGYMPAEIVAVFQVG